MNVASRESVGVCMATEFFDLISASKLLRGFFKIRDVDLERCGNTSA